MWGNRSVALVVLCCAACVVPQAKYDRALGVMSKDQADRLQAETDRDIAVAKLQDQLATTSGALADTRDKAAKERAAMQGELAANKEELEAVRQQRLLTEARLAEW